MNKLIDINCDLGEGYGIYRLANDAEIMDYITSCNIACGFHAGDPSVIVEAILLAISKNVKVGAHPSYFDLNGFGRRHISYTPNEIFEITLYQVSAIDGIAKALGGKLNHVKLHGALYNFTAESYAHCKAALDAVKLINPDLSFYGLPGTCHQKISTDLGLKFIKEGFADRLYQCNGKLMSRDVKGSVIESSEEVAEQSFNMINNHFVVSNTGEKVPMEIDSLCFHSDHINILKNLITTKNKLLQT